jgi:DNA polymerase-3 subunit delta'
MARLLNQVVGHTEIVNRLMAALKSDKLPSTFLFVGPEGVGRHKVALGLAQALVCEMIPVACGECPACQRVEKNESEAVLRIAPEKNQIRIDEAHRVIEFLALQAISRARVVVVNGAHLMNPQAANSLLKILEEPPENTYFFLVAPSAAHVLSTIRSRCQVVRFGALTLDQLKKIKPAPDWALQSAMGSLEKLDSFLDPDEMRLRSLAWQVLAKWHRAEEILTDPEAREWIKDRQALMGLVRYWILALRDIRFVQAGEKQRLFNQDQKQGLAALAELPAIVVDQILAMCFDLERALLGNMDPQLSFENFWIKTRSFASEGGR